MIINPVLTEAQKYKSSLQSQWTALQVSANSIARYIWGFGQPQRAFDSFGTDAVDLLKLFDAYCGMVVAYTGTAFPSPIPAGWTLTRNNDGTVTATYAPPSP